MSNPQIAKVPPTGNRTTALVYEKSFATRGMICGVLILLGSPFFVLLFYQTVESAARPGLWTQLFPDWVAPAMICIGMVGGVVTILLSVLFGLLIPSRVTREAKAESDHIGSPPEPALAAPAKLIARERELSEPTHVE